MMNELLINRFSSLLSTPLYGLTLLSELQEHSAAQYIRYLSHSEVFRSDSAGGINGKEHFHCEGNGEVGFERDLSAATDFSICMNDERRHETIMHMQ